MVWGYHIQAKLVHGQPDFKGLQSVLLFLMWVSESDKYCNEILLENIMTKCYGSLNSIQQYT